MILARLFFVSACSAVALALTHAPAHAQTPAPLVPIEHFFDNPEFSGAVLSPSGKFLAARVGGKDQREKLAVVDLSNNSVKLVAHFDDADVGAIYWVNDERLVFDTGDKTVAPGAAESGPGLYAVNRDGSAYKQLANAGYYSVKKAGLANLLPWNTFYQGTANSGNDIYVNSPKVNGPGDIEYVDLRRVDTVTGRSTTVPRPGNATGWLLDAQGEPRLAVEQKKDQTLLSYRDGPQQPWRQLPPFKTYTGSKGAFVPLGFGPDGKLYVRTNVGRDTDALYTYDLENAKLAAEPLLAMKGFDFRGSLVSSNGKLLGVHFLTDAQGTHWFDPAMRAMQDKVDQLLPLTVNSLHPPKQAQSPWVMVTAYSDVQPLSVYVYNTDKQTISKVGDSHSKINPADMGKQDFVRIKARDGLDVPTWITYPKGKKKQLPMVVLVHGGPYVRGGQWGWQRDAQFLASRGYVVVEPEFRGSTGYGGKHYTAGWKQWGLAMQDDIADTARWAIAQGIADPKRVCIAGASYGGYATLMGLIKNPELYRCGINWVGVTDLDLLFNGQWTFQSDVSANWREFGMPLLIGDPVKDAAQFKATSPLAQASRITQPLLMAYGSEDTRVPLYHGTRFRDAVKANNKNVEWVVYDHEGHGWALPSNQIDFWTRVEKFLDKNIGPAAKTE